MKVFRDGDKIRSSDGKFITRHGLATAQDLVAEHQKWVDRYSSVVDFLKAEQIEQSKKAEKELKVLARKLYIQQNGFSGLLEWESWFKPTGSERWNMFFEPWLTEQWMSLAKAASDHFKGASHDQGR